MVTYHIYHKSSDWQARTNSVDPDQMPNCLPFIQQFLEKLIRGKMNLFKVYDSYSSDDDNNDDDLVLYIFFNMMTNRWYWKALCNKEL